MKRTRTVDELVDAARASLQRVTPSEAHAAVAQGAVLVDTRPSELRARDGTDLVGGIEAWKAAGLPIDAPT